ncbi:MAG: hypothetical protein H7X92_09825, partial [Chitinophagales bacterium]|nr:hypothetical protein [Hyphomicrobiales bacterium]
MPSRLITSIILQTLETNVRFAQNLTDFVAGVQNIHKAEAKRDPERGTSANGQVGAVQDPAKFVFRFGGGT